MTLDDVATATKIGSRMLKAIEEEHFDQLPGGIFNKGFVRAYARHLGVDEDQAVADYLATVNASQPIQEPETVLTSLAVKAERARSGEKALGHGGLPWDKLAAGLLLIAFAFALWGWKDHRRKHSEIQAESKPAEAKQAGTNQAEAKQADAKQAAPVSSDQAASSTVTPPVAIAADNPVSTTEPSGPASSPAAPVVQPASPALAGSFTLLIRAKDDSWINVSVDGKDLINQLLPAGTQKSVDAQHEITVRAGNIGGLDFTFNGKKLPAQGATDEVKTVKFDSTGVQSKAAVTPSSQNPA